MSTEKKNRTDTFDVVDGVTIMHTGIFATDDEVQHAIRSVSFSEAAVSGLAGQPFTPIQRISALCESYGLAQRDDGSRYAINQETRELIYAWPN